MIDKEDVAEEIRQELHKDRVYVNDPSEVPEAATPQEGSRGGVYYETGELLVEELDPDKIMDEAETVVEAREMMGDQVREALGDTVGEDQLIDIVRQAQNEIEDRASEMGLPEGGPEMIGEEVTLPNGVEGEVIDDYGDELLVDDGDMPRTVPRDEVEETQADPMG